MPRREQDFDRLASQWGVHIPDAVMYLNDEWKDNFDIAMDAQPPLVTTTNAGIPAFLTTLIDPQLIRVLLTPNKAAQIIGEVKKGTWLDQTQMFQLVERTGEVSSYGDWNNNGSAGLNTTFPQRQAYLYQTIIQYGELEMERAGLAKLSWASELKESAVTVLNKFQNLSYFFGIAGLQNYGLVNDPSLYAAVTPVVKAAPNSGTQWVKNGVVNGTANEIFQDIQTLFGQLVSQSNGLIEAGDALTIAMHPSTSVALTATNTFNVNVMDLVRKNFPNITFETAVQYGAITPTNPQGIAAGAMIQMIARSVQGQDTGFCAFNEKLRSHPLIRDLSAFKQKMTQGTWGTIIRQPFAIASMVGV